ncbi:isoprenoid synthase domain-containing protein [Favolaschia claudopus]|uniref:(2E,6E)-farnesyl diphosphate synthase n=1 Tax=Favolaschia claudopus TaxID=2862362 RepID=A0AAV9Z138_9AGAR
MSFYDSLLTTLPKSSLWLLANDSATMAPFEYLISIPGRAWILRFVEALNFWMQLPPDALNSISKTLNIVLNAWLLIDDIEDGTHLRRGKPVAHSIFGIPQTFNAGSQAFFLAQQEILSMEESSDAIQTMLKAFTDEMVAIHRGQGLEILWRETFRCPTEDEYVLMVADKTSSFFRMMAKLMQTCAGAQNADVDFTPLANVIGIFIQIRDDYVNLTSPAYSARKGFAEDLSEGKFSFPILHGIHANPTDTRILEALKQRPTDPSEKIPIIDYLKAETHSLAYTQNVLEILERQARDEIGRVGGNPMLEKIIDALHEDMVMVDE